jgi:hypothetical protein
MISPIMPTMNFMIHVLLEHLHSMLQEDSRKWVGMLEGTGGKLEVTKCFYYRLSWGWDKNGSPFPQTIDQPPIGFDKINIRPDNALPELIKPKDVSESHQTLGAYKSICGKEDNHLQYLQEKSDNILIARLRCGHLNR